jgi:hypothetical protein
MVIAIQSLLMSRVPYCGPIPPINAASRKSCRTG